MKTKRIFAMVAVAALLAGVSAAGAQHRDPRVNPPLDPLPPLPAGEKAKVGSGEEAKEGDSGQVRRITPLSSAEDWTAGSWGPRQKYLLASFQVYQGADSNPRIFGNSGGGLQSVTNFGGDFALQQLWRNQELTTVYAGGGSLYSQTPELNAFNHQFRISHRIEGRRWTLLLSDQMNYAPDATRGLGSVARPGQVAALLNQFGVADIGNLAPGLTPSQSVLTDRATRIGNTVMGEIQYVLGRRSSWTASASYGLLRFLDPGFIGNSTTGFRTGYNYTLSGRDTIALSYGLSMLRFEDINYGINNHTIHAVYGRKISERFALQLAAGPQVNTFAKIQGVDPIVSWSAQTSLSYRMPRTDLQLSYFRGTTGGSGVLLGSETQQVRFGLGYQLSRQWRASWNIGYAHNDRLQRAGLPGPNDSFHSYSGGVSLNRTLGRHSRLYLNYQAQRQTRGTAGAAGSLRGFRHVFGLGINFRFRPIEVD